MATARGTQMTGGIDPQISIRLLEKLSRRGLTNELYRQLHHLDYDTIKAHIGYCRKIGEFQPDGTNARLQQRLQFVLDQIERKHGSSGVVDQRTLEDAVRMALKSYPLT